MDQGPCGLETVDQRAVDQRERALQPLSVEGVRRVIDRLSRSALGIPTLLQADPPVSMDVITSDFNRWADAIGGLGQRRLPAAEVDRIVREALTGCDSHDVGTKIGRTVAKVLQGRLNRSPTFVAWVINELWPASGPGTKLAIAEALTVHERTRPTRFALDLARCGDCPPAVAALIHKRLRD